MKNSGAIRRLFLGAAVFLLLFAAWLTCQLPDSGVRRLLPSDPTGSIKTVPEIATPESARGLLFPASTNSVLPQQSAPVSVGRQQDEAKLIRLVTHMIDTSVKSAAGAPVEDWRNGTAQVDVGNARAWIVQFAGPVRDSDKSALAAAGARLCGYIPNNAFAVLADGAALRRVAAVDSVRWIGEYKAGYKIQPSLAAKSSGAVSVSVNTFAPEQAAALAKELSALGATQVQVNTSGLFGRVRAELPASEVAKVAALEPVQWIEERLPMKLFNNRASEAGRLNVTNLWAAHGLNGSNQIVAVADTGLDSGSLATLKADFTGRVVNIYALGRPGNWSDTHGHGTHVAGSVLGNGALSGGKYRGIAWGSGLVMQSILDGGGGLGGLPGDLNVLFLQAYTNGARIHSDSWGSSANGFYTAESRDVDEFMWNHPDMLVNFAAGNDGSDNDNNGVVNLDSMGAPATAKNCLTTGGSENFRPPGEATSYIYLNFGFFPSIIGLDRVGFPQDGVNQGMMAFSSRGPCDDGRVKPDIIAPGTDIISTKSAVGSSYWGIAPDNGNYAINGGTSMSTPLASGCAALIRQFLVERAGFTNPSAALLKAVLVNGARSLAPGQYGTGAQQEIPFGHRPNNVEGWGQIDVQNSLLPGGATVPAFYEGAPLATGGTNVHLVGIGGTNALRVTLCWTDFPGTPGSSKALVNDLDLAVIAPDGSTNFYRLSSGPDRTNNIEGIDFAASLPGTYRIEVRGFNVPSGPQPYALVASGPVVPTIAHKPLLNTTNTVDAYSVDAEIATAAAMLDTNALFVLWNTDGSTNFSAAPMAGVTGPLFRAFIPAQPLHTRVRYFITAATNSFAATHPVGAPATQHVFNVTTPVTLTITGTPLNVGIVEPDYGAITLASGLVINASAPSFSWTTNYSGYVVTGWTGTASIPVAGNTNAVSFQLQENSKLTWGWKLTSYGLVQTSTPVGIVNTTTWWNVGAAAQSVVASASVDVTGAVHRFASWYLNGLRLPDNFSVAQNPASGFTMNKGNFMNARYIPESLDANTNGMPDWAEVFYFGNASASGSADPDLDGYSNAMEVGDGSNPRSAASFPVPPVIAHTPLPSLLPQPTPVQVGAVITDNYAVASAVLHWQMNGGPWTNAAMTNGGANFWTAMIADAGTNHDAFVYYVTAADPGGRVTTSAVHNFVCGYPLMIVSPTDLGTNQHASIHTNFITFTITNYGFAPLAWTSSVTQFHINENAEGASNGWTHSGANDLWHHSPYRAHTGVRSWYCGNDATHQYLDLTDARLQLPSFTPGSNAVLTFWQWFNAEYDNGLHFWDGGVIEVSTNGGATFTIIPPVGGYPYLITPNDDSPFAYDQPCLAGFGLGWEQFAVDLSAYANRSIVLRFRFGSDRYTISEGWYIDDVVITSEVGAGDWLQIGPALGVVAAEAHNGVNAVLKPTTLQPGYDYAAVIRIAGSDQFNREDDVRLVMRLRSVPQVAGVSAAQTSTDGSGRVTITNLVTDPDGSPVSLAVEFSIDGGSNWAPLAIAAATSTPAGVALTNSAHWQLNNISATTTNFVGLIWMTTNAPAVSFATNALIRATPTDGTYTGSTLISAPFLIDNIPPSITGASFTIQTSPFGGYAVGPTAVGVWSNFTDIGFGVENHPYTVINLLNLVSTGLVAGSPGVLSGFALNATNLVHLRARDFAGNISSPLAASVFVLDPAGDFDADGFKNAEEETAGTSASDSDNFLRITGTISDPLTSQLAIRWAYVSNRVYSLKLFTNITDAPVIAFTNPPLVIVGSNAWYILTNAPSGSPLHFRLGVQNP